jgi:phage anti-repressor protein
MDTVDFNDENTPLINKIKQMITYDSKWTSHQINETVSYLVQSLMVDTSKEQYPIKLDVIAKLLGYTKIGKIYKLLINNFKKDLDFVLLTQNGEQTKIKKVGSRVHNKKNCVLTITCAKRLCMLSSTKNAEGFRMYFVIVEELLRDCLNKIYTVGNYESKRLIQYADLVVDDVRRGIVNMVNVIDSSGVVYFIRSGILDIFKIGFTRGDPMVRLGKLQVGNHNDLTIYRTIHSSEPAVLENKLHVIFKDNVIRGEWYNITVDDIDAFNTEA